MGVEVQQNTKEEIRDVVIEMEERLSGSWKSDKEDISLQNFFLEIFEKNLKLYKKRYLFGKIKSKYSTNFLKNNPDWLKSL